MLAVYPVIVDERTNIKGDITLGEMVKVQGSIMEDGSWLATEIKHTGLHSGQGCFWVSSFVQFVNDEEIILSDGLTLVRSDDLDVQRRSPGRQPGALSVLCG